MQTLPSTSTAGKSIKPNLTTSRISKKQEFCDRSLGVSGKIHVSVINGDGSVARDYGWFKNLWLDQGLDALANDVIPQAFAAAGKGDGQAATKETPDASNTYTYTNNNGLLTRITSPATPRNFTSADIGRLFFFVSTGAQLMITGIVSTIQAQTVPVGLNPVPANFSTKTAVIYYVNLQGLTSEYSVRGGAGTISKTANVATLTSSTSAFVGGDVGQAIYVEESAPGAGDQARFLITAVLTNTSVTVNNVQGSFSGRNWLFYIPTPSDENLTPISRTTTYSAATGDNGTNDITSDGSFTGQRVLTRTFLFAPELTTYAYNSATAGDGSTFNWTGTTLTITGGTHLFSSADVGKYIQFTSNGDYCVIVSLTNTTTLVTDRAAPTTHTGGAIVEFGSNQYDSVCLSDSDDPSATNANILIRFENGGGSVVPVVVDSPNPDYPGQQLKVTYVCNVYLLPTGISSRAPAPITDPAFVMSTDKYGTSAIEGMALATIDTGGNTQADFDALEPAVPGALALSPSTAALVPFAGPDRTAGIQFTDMVADGYTAGQFSQVYEGTFQISDAVATNWRSMGIFDTNSNAFAFTWLFEANQAKTGNVTLTIRFRKSWNRQLP